MKRRTTLLSLARTDSPRSIVWGDHDIAAALEMAVEVGMPHLSGLECLVQDGIVILRGMVETADTHMRLIGAARDIPGVRHVIDRVIAPSPVFRRAA